MPAPYLAAAAPARDPRQDAGSEPGSLGRTRDPRPAPAPSPQAPSRPLRRPPASRAFPRARTAHARRPRARPAPPIARAPSFLPSLPPRLGNIRDTAVGQRPGWPRTAQARRRRAWGGEREGGAGSGGSKSCREGGAAPGVAAGRGRERSCARSRR